MTNQIDAKKLLADYRAAKRTKEDVEVKKMKFQGGHPEQESKSFLSLAKFSTGRVNSHFLADQGSDAKILPPQILKEMLKIDSSVKPANLERVHEYGMLEKSATPFTCSRPVTATIKLHTRHSTTFMFATCRFDD